MAEDGDDSAVEIEYQSGSAIWHVDKVVQQSIIDGVQLLPERLGCLK
jgi:hypothetical protein